MTGAAYNIITQGAKISGCVYNSELDRWETTWEVYDLAPAEADANRARQIREITDSVISGTQDRLDQFAKTRNYDGILSACTYANSSIPKFQSEGQYCVDARDLTWATLYKIMSEVQTGTRPMPSGYDDIEPHLPALEWPA